MWVKEFRRELVRVTVFLDIIKFLIDFYVESNSAILVYSYS